MSRLIRIRRISCLIRIAAAKRIRTLFCGIISTDWTKREGNDGAVALEAPVNDPDINVQVGLRIATLRKAAGWSQEDLAEHSGVDRSHIGSVESGGKHSLTLDTLTKLAGAFGMSVRDFFNDDMFDR